MKGYIANIEKEALANEDFRRVLYTGSSSQLVLMCLPVGADIGEEVHQLDQFIRCEKGSGVAIMDGVEHHITAGWSVLVPSGARHNIKNTGAEAMKLYTLYAPPNHKDGTVHRTKELAHASEEHFDGVTSE